MITTTASQNFGQSSGNSVGLSKPIGFATTVIRDGVKYRKEMTASGWKLTALSGGTSTPAKTYPIGYKTIVIRNGVKYRKEMTASGWVATALSSVGTVGQATPPNLITPTTGTIGETGILGGSYTPGSVIDSGFSNSELEAYAEYLAKTDPNWASYSENEKIAAATKAMEEGTMTVGKANKYGQFDMNQILPFVVVAIVAVILFKKK